MDKFNGNFTRRQGLIAGAGALMSIAASGPARSQAFPNRPIKIVAPYPPGASTDTITRLYANKLSTALGQPCVIENLPGAAGAIALRTVTRSAKDGYTLFVVSPVLTANPVTRRPQPPFQLADFAGVSMLADNPLVLMVNASLPLNDVQQLMAYAKANPTKVSFGSPGVGTITHLYGELLARTAGVPIPHVPYKGEAQMFVDIIAGRVSFGFAGVFSAKEFTKSGMVRLIGVLSPERLPDYPNAPRLAEAGLKGFDVGSWLALAVPAGTDPAIVARLSEETQKLAKDPEVRDGVARFGLTARGTAPADTDAFFTSDYERWTPIIVAAGLDKE